MTHHAVNNVGRSHDIPVDFVDTPDDEMDAIVEINVNATLKVTKMVLPSMLSRYVVPSFSLFYVTDLDTERMASF